MTTFLRMFLNLQGDTLCLFSTYTQIPITKLPLKFLMNGGIIIIIIINFMCLNVFLHVCLCPTYVLVLQCPEEGVKSPGTVIADCC